MARSPGEPRVRYIALRVDGDPGLSRRRLIDAIQHAGRAGHPDRFAEESGVWLTRFNGSHAIVRCHHTHQDTVRGVLERVERDTQGRPLRLTPMATSGTIRTLVEKHVPGLREADAGKPHARPRKTPDAHAKSGRRTGPSE